MDRKTVINFRDARNSDINAIKRLLDAEKLPKIDCEEHINTFIVAEDQDRIVGAGALEICGGNALVRSLVVNKAYRNQRLARRLMALLESKARRHDVERLFLLTTTASEYFVKLGFNVTERSGIPDRIKETKQFKELCPDSAVAMSRTL